MRVHGAMWRVAVLAGLLGLTACTTGPMKTSAPDEARDFAANEPYNAGRIPRQFAWEDVQRVQPVSYCYGQPLDTVEDLRDEAAFFCKGGTVEYYGQDIGLVRCPMFQPNRMTFICYPEGAVESSAVSK
jgi:hypothetical protein